MKTQLSIAVLFTLTIGASLMRAADTEWTGAADNNFFNDANWTGAAPGSTNDHAFIEGGQNLPATIAADIGTVEIGAVSLGLFDGGGHVVQNGGTLVIYGEDLGVESQIGDAAEESSTWIMNGNATILYDDPLAGGGLDSDGTGKDFDVGKSVIDDAFGRLEMHDNAVLRIADDLKLADGDAGNAQVFMDGNAQITVGSGISVSGTTSMVVAGNSLLVTGNSAGPGNTAMGGTDEGYLTLSTGGGEFASLDIRDSGTVYARTLQQRGGESIVTVRDNGQFHIFDVFEHAEPSLGNATVAGSASGPQRTSHVSSGDGSETTISLFDNAVMSVDSDLEDSGWSGLVLSGGTNRGANATGGVTVLEIADNASFAVHQDLHLTLGNGDLAESTLRVRGPNAGVDIGGDLRMALDEFGDENFGSATIHAELTGNAHATINVGGSAAIGNGKLMVTFADYTPIGGESYQLLSANAIEGGSFLETSLPDLAEGLSWDLVIGGDSIMLSILGGGGLDGDFNGNGTRDVADLDLLAGAMGGDDLSFDLDGDGAVSFEDRRVWVEDLSNTFIGDANFDGEFNSSDFVAVFGAAKYEKDEPATWSEGDWNGDGVFSSSDFVAAFAGAGYESGPREGGLQTVPEPSSIALVLLGLCGLTRSVRRR